MASGRDQTSHISFLVLEAADKINTSLNLTVRVHDGLDPQLFRKSVEYLVKNKNGWPRFSGDKALVENFMRNGYSAELARRRIAVGCNWMSLPGLEYTMNDLVKVNMARVFEIAYYDTVKDPAPTTERLWEKFAHHLALAVHTAAEGIRHHLKYQKYNEPELLLNLLSHGPMEKGVDVSDGGAEYYNLSIDGAGLAIVADSFSALEQHVERQKHLTWEQVTGALLDDFAGTEGEKIRLQLRNSGRYGAEGSARGTLGAANQRRVHGPGTPRIRTGTPPLLHPRILLLGQYDRVRPKRWGDTRRPAGRDAYFARGESHAGVRLPTGLRFRWQPSSHASSPATATRRRCNGNSTPRSRTRKMRN